LFIIYGIKFGLFVIFYVIGLIEGWSTEIGQIRVYSTHDNSKF